MVENIIFVIMVGIFAWLFIRPLDTFYRARLEEARLLYPGASSLIDEFLRSNRPTCFGAANLLRKLKRKRDEYLAGQHK